MKIFSTKIGNIRYSAQENSEPYEDIEFNEDNYESICKKYFDDSSKSLGIRSLICFIDGSYREKEANALLNFPNIQRIRAIQKDLELQEEDYYSLPICYRDELAPYYLNFLRNLHKEYGKFYSEVDIQSLREYDATHFFLKKISRTNPFIVYKHPLKEYKSSIYKVGDFSFLKVKYSQEKASNGIIISHDRSLINIPKHDKIKDCVISVYKDAGSIVSMDYNAFQPRIAFGLAGMKMNYDGDFYSYIAKTNDSTLRQELKTIIFKIFYGQEISPEIISKYFPSISDLSIKTNAFFQKNKYIVAKSGRRRYFDDPRNSQIFNSLIQMTQSDIINEMLTKIDLFIKDKNIRLIGLIVDNFIFDCHDSEKEDLIAFCKKYLQRSRYIPDMSLKLNIKTGKSWADTV